MNPSSGSRYVSRNHRREEPSYYVPFWGGRPKRETPINEDDILNLKILLNTETDLDSFLSKV